MKIVTLSVAFLLPAMGAFAQTNDAQRLKAVAESYARARQFDEAAATYEKLAEVEPGARGVIGPLLVQLYIQEHKPAPALRWAEQVMTNTPDPRAYLAGVYAQMGNVKEARAILEFEQSRTNSPYRSDLLQRQLDALKKQPASRPFGE